MTVFQKKKNQIVFHKSQSSHKDEYLTNLINIFKSQGLCDYGHLAHSKQSHHEYKHKYAGFLEI